MSEHNILRTNSEEIFRYLTILKEQRDEIDFLITMQEKEKQQLKTEIDRFKYKYGLVAKSLNQRILTREKYDQTIKQAEDFFERIIQSSDSLLVTMKKDAGELEETINKNINTEISKPTYFKSIPISSGNVIQNEHILPAPQSKKELPMHRSETRSTMDCAFATPELIPTKEQIVSKRGTADELDHSIFNLGNYEQAHCLS